MFPHKWKHNNQCPSPKCMSLLITLFCDRVWALQAMSWLGSHCSSSRLKSRDELEVALWTSRSFHPGAKVTRLVRLQANPVGFEIKAGGQVHRAKWSITNGFEEQKKKREKEGMRGYVFHRNVVTFIDWEIAAGWLHYIPLFYSSPNVLLSLSLKVASELCCQSPLCFTVWGFRGSSRSSQWDHKTLQLSKDPLDKTGQIVPEVTTRDVLQGASSVP